MTRSELESYRQQLFVLGGRLNGDVAQLSQEALRRGGGEASGNLSNMPFHLADLASDNFEQEVTLDLLSNEAQRRQEIQDAIDRIDNGTFGRCEECHLAIGKGRLQAVPYTRYCVDCARHLQEQANQV